MAICGVFGGFLCAATAAAPGQLDPTFGNGTGIVLKSDGDFLGANAIAFQASRKILIAGNCGASGTDMNFCVARYHVDGRIDLSFGVDGVARLAVSNYGSFAEAIDVFPDGGFVVGGWCQTSIVTPNSSGVSLDFCIARFTSNGAAESTFGNAGSRILSVGSEGSRAYTVKTQSDGKVLIAGTCTGAVNSDFCIVRTLSTGQLDPSFGMAGVAIIAASGLDDSAYRIATTSSGEILLGGACSYTYVSYLCLAKLLHNGSPDPSFGVSGVVVTGIGVTAGAHSIAVETSGRIIAAGNCAYTPGGETSFCMARYSPLGALDPSFGVGGVATVNFSNNTDASRGLVLQAGGKYVVGGFCWALTGTFEACLARFDQQGQLDTSFNGNGTYTFPIGGLDDKPFAVGLQSDNKIVLVGSCADSASAGASRLCAARLRRGPYNPLTCALNADANNTVDPATDALLLTRYLLGLRGAALTSGALGQNPTRTGQALETYLASLNLDADGDGQALAMTDGLLILRAMLGLTGSALTQGATNAAHPNVRNAQQILTWIESTHGVACLP